MDRVERQIRLAVSARDILDHRGGIIAPAALLIAERPTRRQRRAPGQLGVARQHVAKRGPAEKIIIHLAAVGAEARVLLRALSEIEVAAVAVVEEQAVNAAVPPAQI